MQHLLKVIKFKHYQKFLIFAVPSNHSIKLQFYLSSIKRNPKMRNFLLNLYVQRTNKLLETTETSSTKKIDKI